MANSTMNHIRSPVLSTLVGVVIGEGGTEAVRMTDELASVDTPDRPSSCHCGKPSVVNSRRLLTGLLIDQLLY